MLRQHKIEKLPIVDKDFHLKGLITIKDIEKAVAVSQLRKGQPAAVCSCAAAIGVTADVLDRARRAASTRARTLSCSTPPTATPSNIMRRP